MELTITAGSYAHKGLSVIPTLADKRPAIAWKPFTERIMNDAEIEIAFGEGQGQRSRVDGIGIVCGRVSGNLEVLDFDDGGSAFEPWKRSLDEGLVRRLVVERSPSGGKHVYYRVGGEASRGRSAYEGDGAAELIRTHSGCAFVCPTAADRDDQPYQGEACGAREYYYAVPGNRKLAMKADGHVLVETRGEGGYVKCAPSEGYVLEQGDFLHIPTISPLEEEMLVKAAEALDEGASRGRSAYEGDGAAELIRTHSGCAFVRPTAADRDDQPYQGKAYVGEACQVDLAGVLGEYGWKKVREDGRNEHWERPGKDGHTTSATWNGECFYVFSSNAAPFEPNKGYSAFHVYALLKHGGDMRSAGFALRVVGGEASRGRSAYEGEACGARRRGTESAPYQGEAADRDDQPYRGEADRGDDQPYREMVDPGALPEELMHVPGFVDKLAEHTMRTAPYPNRPLAFAGALAMLSHLSGRNFRNERNLRTNFYLLALADSGVGKDYPRKVNMNLAAEVGIMPTMADRFASAEGLEDALLVHPTSMFAVDEIDTLFAALNEKGDSAMEKIYGALLQFATSADTTYAMRKKAISQVGGKQSKFDKVRARGIREPHLTLLGTGIPKYLWGAISMRAMENGLLSRCLVLEAGERGKAGAPHYEPFESELLEMARSLVSHGGFEGLDLEQLDEAPTPYVEPITIGETGDAAEVTRRITAECEKLYDASTDTAAKALWTRGAEKTGKLALLYAISENVYEPLITPAAVEWAWKVVKHLTERTLYQASVYVHESEFDALRQKAIRYLRDYGNGSMNHGALLRYMHIDADTFRRVIETLVQSELITAAELTRGGIRYTLV